MTRAAEIATTRRLIAESNARISRLIAMPSGTKKRKLLALEEGNLRDLTKDLARLEGLFFGGPLLFEHHRAHTIAESRRAAPVPQVPMALRLEGQSN